MAKNQIATVYDDNGFPTTATFTQTVNAAGGVQSLKGGPGRLMKILVTVAPTTNPVTVYDNASAASGVVLAIIPAATVAGTVYDVNLPANLGITVNGAAAAGSLTVAWS
jgi:hypothetical protein